MTPDKPSNRACLQQHRKRCLDGIFIASKMLVRQSLQKEGALLTTSDKKNVVQSQLSEKPQHRGKV